MERAKDGDVGELEVVEEAADRCAAERAEGKARGAKVVPFWGAVVGEKLAALTLEMFG